MRQAAVQVQGLLKSYSEVRALAGLDLHVERGVVYGFLGPNGAGKTTTLRVLCGLARADGGDARILGDRVHLHDPAQQRRIGFLPEEPVFYRWMTAREYLQDFVAPLQRLPPEQIVRRTEEVLSIVGLGKAAGRRVGGYSRGMRQRLGLAQAIIHQPALLLLDEPVSALDPAGRKELLDLIDFLRGETTILLSTHILADVERVCDVVGIIDRGRMLVEERRETLLERYGSPILEVEVDGNRAEWVASLHENEFVDHLEMEQGTIRLWLNRVEQAQQSLFQSLATESLRENLRVRRYELVRPSLEDVFLRLTSAESCSQGVE